MSQSVSARGACLCGAVQVETSSMDTEAGVCHCNMCRKWGGGPFMAVDCKLDLTVSGKEKVQEYDSSDWARRGFCATCGTHIYYQVKQTGQYILSAGLLNQESSLHMDHQIFIDEKPEYYRFANETKNMTGAEVFAQFVDGGEG